MCNTAFVQSDGQSCEVFCITIANQMQHGIHSVRRQDLARPQRSELETYRRLFRLIKHISQLVLGRVVPPKAEVDPSHESHAVGMCEQGKTPLIHRWPGRCNDDGEAKACSVLPRFDKRDVQGSRHICTKKNTIHQLPGHGGEWNLSPFPHSWTKGTCRVACISVADVQTSGQQRELSRGEPTAKRHRAGGQGGAGLGCWGAAPAASVSSTGCGRDWIGKE